MMLLCRNEAPAMASMLVVEAHAVNAHDARQHLSVVQFVEGDTTKMATDHFDIFHPLSLVFFQHTKEPRHSPLLLFRNVRQLCSFLDTCGCPTTRAFSRFTRICLRLRLSPRRSSRSANDDDVAGIFGGGASALSVTAIVALFHIRPSPLSAHCHHDIWCIKSSPSPSHP